MITEGMMSSNSREWETPQDFFDKLDAEFHFDLDPCATPANAKCRMYYTGETDGLKKHWAGYDGAVFVNPPYGHRRWNNGYFARLGKIGRPCHHPVHRRQV